MVINAQVTRQAGGLPYKWIMAIVLVFGAFMPFRVYKVPLGQTFTVCSG